MLKLMSTLIALTLYTAPALAEDCTCDGELDNATLLQGQSKLGRAVQIRFEANPVKKSTKKANLCVSPLAQVNEVVLWMPDHNHGSAPTRLNRHANGCTVVENISFVMTGLWDLRVKLADNDESTLSVEVVK